jgi:hypothetical protein
MVGKLNQNNRESRVGANPDVPHPNADSRTTRRFGHYIGRAGALAVALGVGSALTPAIGVASATPNDTESSSEATGRTDGGSADTSSRGADRDPASSTEDDTETGLDAANETEPDPGRSGEEDDVDVPAAEDPESDDDAIHLNPRPAQEDSETTTSQEASPSNLHGNQSPYTRENQRNDDSDPQLESRWRGEVPETGEPGVSTTATEPAALDTAGHAKALRSTQKANNTAEYVRAAAAPAFADQPAELETPLTAAPLDPPTVLSALPVPLADTPAPSTPAAPMTLWTLLASIGQQLRKTFTNSSPTIVYDQLNNTLVEGSDHIAGKLEIVDHDDDHLEFTATAPSHGRVTVNADGTFVYDPEDGYTGPDRFEVSVSDATDFHFHGLLGFLQPHGGHAATKVINVTATAPDVSGTTPTAPAAPSLTPSATSVLVTWTKPDGGGSPITRYSLRYRPTGGGWSLAPDAPAAATSATITGLLENTDYEISVRASNALGNSAWSAARPTHTTGEVVPDPDSEPPPAGNVLWQDKFDTAINGQLTKVTGDALFGPTAAATNGATYQYGSIHIDPDGGKFLRQSIPAGELGAFIVSPVLSQPTDHAILSYDIRFDDNFDWRWGGKMPGLVGVAPGHGIYEPTSGNANRDVGFSTRLMWHGRGDDGTRPFEGKLGPIPAGSDNDVVTYIYAKNPSAGFNGYGWHTNLGTELQRGQWHRITMEVQLNTVGASDGVYKVWIDDSLRYSATDWEYRSSADVQIEAVLYDIHRGGGTTPPSWVSTRDTHIDVRNMVVTGL